MYNDNQLKNAVNVLTNNSENTIRQLKNLTNALINNSDYQAAGNGF